MFTLGFSLKKESICKLKFFKILNLPSKSKLGMGERPEYPEFPGSEDKSCSMTPVSEPGQAFESLRKKRKIGLSKINRSNFERVRQELTTWTEIDGTEYEYHGCRPFFPPQGCHLEKGYACQYPKRSRIGHNYQNSACHGVSFNQLNFWEAALQGYNVAIIWDGVLYK